MPRQPRPFEHHHLRKFRALGIREGTRWVLRGAMFRYGFSLAERLGFHLLPIHHSSPVPDTRELRRTLPRWSGRSELLGVSLDPDRQSALLEALRAYEEELRRLPTYDDVMSRWLGEGYSAVDGEILYGVVRHLKPRRVVEVGAGVSTFYCAEAARANERDGAPCAITSIDPGVRPALRELCRRRGIRLVESPVQEADRGLFSELDRDDILFIDSTHVVRIGGDVVHLYLDVVPRLRAGVVIQIHDIPFPALVPDPHEWVLRRHMFWTEPALVYALLMDNPRLEVLLAGRWLHERRPEALSRVLPSAAGGESPASLWLRVSDAPPPRGGGSGS